MYNRVKIIQIFLHLEKIQLETVIKVLRVKLSIDLHETINKEIATGEIEVAIIEEF